MDKIIIDSQQKKKSGHFALNLKYIEDIEDISLNLSTVIEVCEDKIKEKKFNLADKYLTLASRLSSYGNEKVNGLKLNYYYSNILYKYENKEYESILGAIDLLLKLKTFFPLVYSFEKIDGFNVDKALNEIKLIEANIDLFRLLEVKHKEGEYLSLKEIKELNEYLVKNEDLKIISLKQLLINIVNDEIKDLKNCSNEKAVSFICSFLREEYSGNFFDSKEFLNVINYYKEFENYYTLSEVADKAYLLYKFNNGKDLNEKVQALYSNLIPKYLNLSTLYKEHLVNEIVENKDKYYIIDEFFNMLNEKLDALDKENKNNSIPV